MEYCVSNKMGETTDVDEWRLFAQMRMQGVGMTERSNASIVELIWVPYVCVGGICWVIWRPLAEQLWEHAVEELMTGPAGQNPCRPQLLVNMPAEKTEFRERSATILMSCSSVSHTLTNSHTNSWEFRTQAVGYNETFRCCFIVLGGKALKVCWHPTVFVYFVLFINYIHCESLWKLFGGKTIKRWV